MVDTSPMSKAQTLGDIFRARGLSVVDVAAATRIDASRLYKLRSAKVTPRTRGYHGQPGEAARLARFLGMTEAALLRLF